MTQNGFYCLDLQPAASPEQIALAHAAASLLSQLRAWIGSSRVGRQGIKIATER
jgi:hypothetical protein